MSDAEKSVDVFKDPSPSEIPVNSATFKSEALFKGQQQLVIEHEGVVYMLRITKQGKLILTK